MVDVGTDLVRFAQLCREMGGSTDVQFRSPSNAAIGSRSLLTCERDGLKAGDALDAYVQATVATTAEYNALKALTPGLENGVKVRFTYSHESVVMLALAGAVLNDFGSLVETNPGSREDLRLIAKRVQGALPRPGAH